MSLVLVACATLAFATACGGSSSVSQGSAAQSGDIVIGTIGTFSGPTSTSIVGGEQTMTAWASDVNAAGGIDGHHVKLIVEDDGGSSTTALTLVKQLIDYDHVVAIVADMSNPDSVWAPVAASAGVPVVGGISIDSPFATNPDFFPVGANIGAVAFEKVAAPAHYFGSNVSEVYCAEAPECATFSSLYPIAAKSLPGNVSVATRMKTLATAPNYTAQCQTIRDSGAQSLIVDEGTAEALNLLDQCAGQGVTAKAVGCCGTVNDQWLTHPAASGALDIEAVFPFFDSSTPATAKYQTFLQRHHLGDGDGSSGVFGYLSGELFEAAVKGINGPITSTAIKQSLYKMKGETLGGLTVPLTFTPGKPTLINCSYVVQISGRKFTTPQGLTPSCAPSAAVGQILKQLTSA
jgi:branched-chain amino acid transport system substrate-binding protein